MSPVFPIRPLGHMLDLSGAPLNSNPLAARLPSKNLKVSSSRVVGRWDHFVLTRMDDDEVILKVPVFRKNDGTTETLILTQRDIAKVTSATYQYLTPTYTTGQVTAIETVTGPLYRVTVNTDLTTSGIEVGDKFILDDDLDEDNEGPAGPPNPWAEVASVTGTTGSSYIYLQSAYLGTTGTGLTENYRVRLRYPAPPTGERWCHASVNGKFCFSHGNVNVQVYDGTGNAADLDATYARNARCMITYGDRLLIGDILVGGVRNPWTMRWSKLSDPADWIDTTAGSKQFLDTDDPLMNMGVVGGMLFVYKKNMYHIGRLTEDPDAPFSFVQDVRGAGVYARDSLVHFNGTNAFLGLDDFYMIQGDQAVPIGGPIRREFFRLVSDVDLVKVFAMNNARYHELLFVDDTAPAGEGGSGSQLIWSYDYKENPDAMGGVWSVYTFDSTLTGLGGLVF